MLERLIFLLDQSSRLESPLRNGIGWQTSLYFQPVTFVGLNSSSAESVGSCEHSKNSERAEIQISF